MKAVVSFVLACVLWAACNPAVSNVPVDVKTVAGKTVTGILESIDGTHVRVKGAEGTINLKITDVTFVGFAADETALKSAEKGYNWVINTACKGEVLHAKNFKCNSEKADLDGPGWQIRNANTAALARVVKGARLYAPDTKLTSAEPSELMDTLVIAAGKSTAEVSGELRNLDEQSVLWRIAGKEKKVALDKALAVIFRQRTPIKHKPMSFRVRLLDGTTVVLREMVFKDNALKGKWAGGDFATCPPYAQSIEFDTGRIVYVSDTEPEAVETKPFFDVAWGWRRDSNIDGKPIKLRGKHYSKGIGAHPYLQLTYNIENLGFQSFRAVIGIDDAGAARGSARFLVIADDKEIYNSPVLSGDSKPLELNLDVKNVKRLTLVTAFGSKLDNFGAYAVWADARLMR